MTYIVREPCGLESIGRLTRIRNLFRGLLLGSKSLLASEDIFIEQQTAACYLRATWAQSLFHSRRVRRGTLIFALEMSEHADSVPNKWAVLIGIEYYQDAKQHTTIPRHGGRDNGIKYNDLFGCVNDILAIEQYLTGTIKVEARHITKLLAPRPGGKYLSQVHVGSYRDPPYGNIVDALKVPKGAKKGDFVYIHFSGHGARATTVFPELKNGGGDAEDQALVPSDITRGGKYLRDLEMGILLQAMVDAGLVVTVVLDCCHSGGAVRGDADPELGETRGIRGIYKSDPVSDLPSHSTMERIMHFGRQPSWMHAPRGFVVLAACQEHQTAKEKTETDHSHGLLTYWLLEILRNSPMDFSSQALYERICAKVQDSNQSQTPYLVGDKDRFFFSKTLRSRVYALAVSKAYVESYKEPIDHSVRLAGGKLHGVKKGSEYAILPWGFDLSKRIQGTDVLGRVKVKEVMAGESLAFFTPLDKARREKIVEGCPAVLQKLPIAKKSSVYFVTPDDKARDNFKREWHEHEGDKTWLSLDEKDDSSPFFAISIDENGNFRIRDRPGNFTEAIGNALRPLPAVTADSTPALIRRLEHLAKFKTTRELANPGIQPGTLISIKVDAAPEGQRHPSGQWLPPAETGEWMAGVYEVDEMTLFRIAIRNQSGRRLGCVVLDFGAEFGIEHVFPRSEPYCILGQRETKDAYFWMEVAPELRAPANDGVPIVDTLKIFVCDPVRNIDSLRLPGLKEMEDGTRSGASERSTQVSGDLLSDLSTIRLATSVSAPDTWETVDVKIRIKPLLG